MRATTPGATWEEVELGDIVTLHRGYDLPSAQRHEGTVPIVSSSGITGYHDQAKISPPGVVTGRYGTLGEVFFLEEPFWPLNTTLYVSDFHGNDERFVSYLLRCQRLGAHDAAAAVPGVNRNVLHRLPARRPPIETQRKIAAILSAYDDLIENNIRRIRLLEEMVQRTYREWFIAFRYPGHEDVVLDGSELGPIPSGWEVMRTSDLIAKGSLAIGDGYRAKNSEMAVTGLPFVRIGDLREDFQFEGVDLLSPDSCAMAGNKISRHGDCIVSTKGTVGRVLFVPASAGQFVYSPQLSYWRVLGDDVCSEYLICWMRGPDFIRQCATVKGATDMADYVNLKDQRLMLLPVPPLNIQRGFADLVKPMLDTIANLWRSSANLRSTRQLLLPRLVSGALDVTDLSIEVPEAAA